MYHFISLAFINTFSGLPSSNASTWNQWHYPAVNRSSPGVSGRNTQARLAQLQCKHLPNAPNQCLDYSDWVFLFCFFTGTAQKMEPKGKIRGHCPETGWNQCKILKIKFDLLKTSSVDSFVPPSNPSLSSRPNRKPTTSNLISLQWFKLPGTNYTFFMGTCWFSVTPPQGIASPTSSWDIFKPGFPFTARALHAHPFMEWSPELHRDGVGMQKQVAGLADSHFPNYW